MDATRFQEYIKALPGVWKDEAFTGASAGLIAYKTGLQEGEGKLFAIVHTTAQPLRLSLRCDPNLALTLRERYETVLPGENLSKRDWNTVICSGQLPEDEVLDLIQHAHQHVRTELEAQSL